jgi:hypothetical protein
LKTDCPDGFKYFERSPMQTALEGDFDTGNMRYKARERYSFGYSNFRAVYGSQGSLIERLIVAFFTQLQLLGA